jgi:hypothetical protein
VPRSTLLALALAAIACLLYAPALTADFVWDARAKVLMSDFIHDPANLPDVLTGRVLGRDVLDNNRPANLLSLMVDSALWGRRPAGYHATSVTLHAAVCAMLFLLLLRLLASPGGTWPAFFAALIFAVHPLNCEPVSEVSYREDLLVAASILAALFAAMAFLRKPGLWRNLLLGLLCCLALLFGVGAKENGAAGPVVLAAYWLLWRRGEPRVPWAALIAAACLVVFGFLAARFALAPAHSVIFTSKPPRLGGTLPNTLLIQLRIWAMEFSQVLLPHDLCADYGVRSLSFSVPVSAAIFAGVVAGQVYLACRDRLLALGFILFWAGLLPVANIVPIYRPMADRFLYVPLLGISMMVAQGLFLARKLRPEPHTALYMTIYAALFVWISAAAAVTFRREAVWHDSLALWQDTAAGNPFSDTAANNLGWALLAAHREEEAAASFQRAIRLTRAAEADPWAGLALAGEAASRPAAADAAYRRAVALDPRYAHPRELMRALVSDSEIAGKLEVLSHRNTKP